MKKTYERPVVLANQTLAEGVFLASGTDCYTTTAYIHQSPETGRGDFRIQVNAKHDADHNSKNNQCLHISFNQPVIYKSSQGNLESGDGTCTLDIAYAYWNNYTDNIGLGDVVVESDPGLAITFVWLEDRAKVDFRS